MKYSDINENQSKAKFTLFAQKSVAKSAKFTCFFTCFFTPEKWQSVRECTIYARVVDASGVRKVSSGISCPDTWLAKGCEVIPKRDASHTERKRIATEIENFKSSMQSRCESGATGVRVQGKGSAARTIADALRQFATSTEIKPNTARNAKAVLTTWLRFTGGKNIALSSINSVLPDFVEYLRTEPASARGRHRQGATRSENATAASVSCLLTACRAAASRAGADLTIELPKHDRPREQYRAEPNYLTIDELQRVEAASLPPDLAAWRDAFVLQCRTGVRVSDLCRLTIDNITTKGSQLYLVVAAQKTGKVVNVPISAKTAELVSRLRPIRRQPDYNAAIRSILREAGVNRLVPCQFAGVATMKPVCEIASSHIARRTFVGVMYESGQDIATIASMSGHAKGSRAIARYFDISDQRKENAVKVFD